MDISELTKEQLEGIINAPRIALMHWGYRKAIAMKGNFRTFDRDEPWVKEMERDLNHQCMSQPDNHTTFHIRTASGDFYVTFSDCIMWIGTDVKIQQWN